MKPGLKVFGIAVIGAMAADCGGRPPATRVLEAKEIGVVQQSRLIVGRDGGESARIWGRSIWTFGDTVTSVPDAEGQTWHHNSYSFTLDPSAADGITGLTEPVDALGAPGYLIAPTADEEAFNLAHRGDPCAEQPCGARFAAWPGAPLIDAPRNRALIPYGLVWAAPGDFNFHGVGQSFAIWSDFASPPERPIVSPGTAHPTLLFGEGEPAYASPVMDWDTLYAYDCQRDLLAVHCSLAKVDPGRVLDRSAWLFWDGTRWSDRMTDARPVLDASSNLTVQFNRHLGQWTATYTRILSNDVMMRTAPALTGPWSDALRLFVADRKGQGGNSYDAQPHAEYAEDDGRILYFSFSRPTGQGWFGGEFALVRVTLE